MDTKPLIESLLETALESCDIAPVSIEIEVPNDTQNGDFSTNLAMKLAGTLKKAPIIIAEELKRALPTHPIIKKVEIAKPGFINFFIDKTIYHVLIHEINQSREAYGNLSMGEGEHTNIEFVSANPTGSLHIGHARGAAAGDALARILKKAGFQVTKEFYVNDGGNQIKNLALSIDARYRQAFGLEAELPEDGYYGKEIMALAEQIKTTYQARFLKEDGLRFFRQYGVDYLLEKLNKDLSAFGVTFDVWFSEASLYEQKQIESTIAYLNRQGFTYEDEGATWLKTSQYGDEKDRVIIKSDGTYTYILPDIAYHKNKLARGYTKLIDILGADHHGYVPRLKAAIEMVGGKPDLLEVDILQMVKVIQDGQEVKMSKRSGKAITLADLIDEVGPDPIRYFFAMRSLNTHMELDLDLALKQTNENPVYYAQYAHARIASLMVQAKERGIDYDLSIKAFETFDSDKIDAILTTLADYPSVIEEAATKRIPHRVTQYIHRLAQNLHSFYASEVILSDNKKAASERLTLLHAVKIVLKDALHLVGVQAVDHM